MMNTSRAFAVLSIAASFGAQACARNPSVQTDPSSYKGPPTTRAITPGDLRTRLYIFSDDSMRGRAAGTADNLRGAAYIERELRKLGVEPAGENGTYFQDVPLSSRVIAANASLTVAERRFAVVSDIVPRDNGPGMRSIDGVTAIYGGDLADTASLISPSAAAGKLVVLTHPSAATTNRAPLNRRYSSAAGIAVATVDRMNMETRLSLTGPSLGPKTETQSIPNSVPTFLYVSNAFAAALFGSAPLGSVKPGQTGGVVRGNVGYQAGNPLPGRNVIAIVRGSDPRFRAQYVALGAHNDHDPVMRGSVDHDSLRAYNAVARRQGAEGGGVALTDAHWARIRAIRDSLRALRPPRVDSIMNGADDDGTGSMALLEIAEYFAKSKVKPKRSVLFVWHTAEEIGLLGSEYFTDHPTVPRDSIVAQLNIDMIGRGGPTDVVHILSGQPVYGSEDFVEVIGSRRLSTELGDIVDASNAAQPRPLVFSKVFDANGEPHQMYCRSDHYMYARYGIPVTFFFTSVHQDYHQPTDEAQYINYPKYARIVNVIRETVDRVANLDHRPVVDKPKPNPRGACVQ